MTPEFIPAGFIELHFMPPEVIEALSITVRFLMLHTGTSHSAAPSKATMSYNGVGLTEKTTIMFRNPIPLVIGIFTLACSGETSDDTGTPETGPSASTEYYEVTGDGLWQGQHSYETHMAGLRALQPESSTIFEQFIGLGEEAGEAYEGTADVDLETHTFTFAYTDGSYEGTGILYGEAWDWHAWESETFGSDGTRVVSEDTKDENGIIAYKTGYDAEGQEQWTLQEVLTPITEAEWLALQEGIE